MTQEEYYKAQICAQVYRKQVRENHLLRQKLAGKDPESLEQDRQDREAFALVHGRKNNQGQLQVVQIRAAAAVRRAPIARREADCEERNGIWERIAAVVFGAVILMMPLVWLV